MATHLNAKKGKDCSSAQLLEQAGLIRAKYGPQIGWNELLQVLQDRACVRYPCEIQFDEEPLLPGEFAHSTRKGIAPEEGFTIYIHPSFAAQLSRVPYAVLCQLALVNNGETTSPDDAEVFGAQALGLSKDAYYQALCEMSSQLGGDELC